jgi:ParB/RepB/Spo0J family partition protein
MELDFAKLLEKVGEETTTEAVAAGREIKELLVSSIGFYAENRELRDEDCIPLMEELQEDDWDLTHPIVVFPDQKADRDYTLIAGERRLRAFQLGKQDSIIAIIRRDLTERQIREKNIKENTQRLDESLPSLSRRYKKYCEDFKVTQKEAARIFNVKESQFSDMVKYLWQVDKIPATKALLDEGVSDKWMLKELVRASMKNEAAVRSIIAFGKANNCFDRNFVLAAVKMDLHGDIEAELRVWLAGGQQEEPAVQSAKKEQPKVKPEAKPEEQLDLSGITTENTEDSLRDENPVLTDSAETNSLNDGSGSDSTSEDETDEIEEEMSEEQTGTKDSLTGSEEDAGNEQPGQNGVKKRPVSKAEIMVEYSGKQFYLELGLVAEDEDKIVLRNLAGDVVIVSPGEVKICYVS